MGPSSTDLRPLLLAALAAGGLSCKPAEPPRSAANLPPSGPVRRFRTPRVSCDAPANPGLAAGWAMVGWPTVPRFLSVEAEGAVLYATTTSTVCRSVDGGQRWDPVLVDLDAPSLIAVEGARIVLRAEEAFEARESVDTVWWVTDDGGTRWARHARPPEVGQGRIARIAIHARDVEGEYAAVSCGDAYYAIVPSLRGRVPIALRSENGGVTWSRMTLPRALRQPGVTFRCVGHDAVVLERGGAVPLVTAYSRNRGARWESVLRMPAAARAFESDGVPGDDAELPSSGCAPLSGRGVFCEVRGQAWASSDRGRRWYRANSPVGGRAVPMHGEFLLGVGGGIARSTDAGRQWEIVTVAPGRANLGFRGGVVSSESYWLAGSVMWWTDDGGQRWTASQLPFELVAVLGRDRWIGLRPNPGADGCGTAMLTTTRGRLWRPSLTQPVRRVVERAGELRAWACNAERMFVSTDGLRWRATAAEPEPDEPAEELAAVALDGARVELRDGALRASGPGGADEVIAQAWPRDIAPVAVASGEGRPRVVVFGNGTVLRRP